MELSVPEKKLRTSPYSGPDCEADNNIKLSRLTKFLLLMTTVDPSFYGPSR